MGEGKVSKSRVDETRWNEYREWEGILTAYIFKNIYTIKALMFVSLCCGCPRFTATPVDQPGAEMVHFSIYPSSANSIHHVIKQQEGP